MKVRGSRGLSRHKTKDEQFLLALYHKAKASQDPEAEFSVAEIGQSLGLSPRVQDTIVNTLAKTNFVKKSSFGFVQITAHGIRIAQVILQQ